MNTSMPCEADMTSHRRNGRELTLEEAAGRLGVETAAVRMFVRLKLLRTASGEPPAVWEMDVERLRRVLLRQHHASAWVGA
jgi:hypothetical protein